jgi:CRP-like cAMP-binding protein
VRYLSTGDFFGEVALLYPVLRTATVLATNYADLAVLAADDFNYICGKYPSTRRHFHDSALRYSDEWKQFLTAILRRCPFFQKVSLRALRELIYYLPITTLEANAYIYKSGETAEKITFLLSGEVVVYVLITDFRIKAAQFYKTKAKHKRLSTQAVQTFIYALAHKNDRFIVEFEMDYLERGSVICHNLTLLNHPSFMSVKTMSTCTVATLSVSQLAAISANIPEIGQAINNYKALMRTNVAIHPVIKHHLGATDYHKWFGLNLGLEQGKRLWHAKMVLRKCVFGKLFERRENRRIGFSELPNLSQRV